MDSSCERLVPSCPFTITVSLSKLHSNISQPILRILPPSLNNKVPSALYKSYPFSSIHMYYLQYIGVQWYHTFYSIYQSSIKLFLSLLLIRCGHQNNRYNKNLYLVVGIRIKQAAFSSIGL